MGLEDYKAAVAGLNQTATTCLSIAQAQRHPAILAHHYRYQELVAERSIDALIDKNRRFPDLKNRLGERIEVAVILNDKVLPFYEANALPVLRILTDRGTEYCGKVEKHDYQLYLAIDNIDHTKNMSSQNNGICDRFHKIILQEYYQVTFRKKLYSELDELRKICTNGWVIQQ
ncbi:hypothetical protein JT25_003820 [Methylomonas denitrificans]|uniref:Transposase n=1 Tax=Methylomonas denitrificans TaxID=1538553 RepID=A0A140E5E7_9GAMM|nr:hypothetical protein JT25_003820 [Methylomonas denitrificans]